MPAPPAAPKESAPAPRTDIAAAVGAEVETTLYGDLPEDFWGEQQAGSAHDDQPAPPAAGSPDQRAKQADDPRAPRGGDHDEHREVPLFVPTGAGNRSPQPSNTARSGELPSEPEGERYQQLQMLFPGRIIEVSRRVSAAAGGATAADGADDAPATAYDDYASTATTESGDEPRYDTAAEAAAEESR